MTTSTICLPTPYISTPPLSLPTPQGLYRRRQITREGRGGEGRAGEGRGGEGSIREARGGPVVVQASLKLLCLWTTSNASGIVHAYHMPTIHLICPNGA